MNLSYQILLTAWARSIRAQRKPTSSASVLDPTRGGAAGLCPASGRPGDASRDSVGVAGSKEVRRSLGILTPRKILARSMRLAEGGPRMGLDKVWVSCVSVFRSLLLCAGLGCWLVEEPTRGGSKQSDEMGYHFRRSRRASCPPLRHHRQREGGHHLRKQA